MTTGPLDGVRVLEVSQGIAGEVAGMLLADLGADVVRSGGAIPPLADRAGWLYRNRGKTLVRISDVPLEAACEVRRLADRADVVVVDGRNSAVRALGLDATTVRSRSSRTIHVALPPISATGRFADLPAHDLLLDGLSGFAAYHPAFEDRPVASVVSTRRVLQGTLGAVHTIAALVGRQHDGRARPVSVGGMRAVSMILAGNMVQRVDGPPLYIGLKTPEGSPHFRLYQGSDGRWFHLATLGINLFLEALNAIDRMDVLARDDVAGEFANLLVEDIGLAVGRELQSTFLERPAQQWVELLRSHDVPVALVGERDGWLTGEVVSHACPPVRREHPNVGELLLPAFPVELASTPGTTGRAPSAGDVADPEEVWADVDPGLPGPIGDEDPPALAGIRALDAATYMAGPFVSTLLAQMGADVTKVQSPDGDPYRTYGGAFAAINHLKPSVYVDLASPDGRDELLAMIGDADVMVHNLRPASLARLGLSDDTFLATNPRLVLCVMTAYGDRGPWVDFPAFDQIVQSMSGLAVAQAGAGRPVVTGSPVHDTTAGALGALGTLAALYARADPERAGDAGQRVTTSLVAASTLLQGAELTSYEGRSAPPVGGRDFLGSSPTERFYRAADRWVAVATTTTEQRAALYAATGVADVGDAEEQAASIADALSSASAEAWIAALGAAGVPAVPVTHRAELENPYLVELDWSKVIDDPDLGRLRVSNLYGDWPSVRTRQ